MVVDIDFKDWKNIVFRLKKIESLKVCFNVEKTD